VPMALERGHHVTAFIRTPSKVPAAWKQHKNFVAVQAESPDVKLVTQTLTDSKAQVVLSMLASDNAPHTAISGAAVSTIGALTALQEAKQPLPRYIFIGGRGLLGEPLTTMESVMFKGIGGLLFSKPKADFDRAITALKATQFPWTILLPGLLTNSPFTGRYIAGDYQNGAAGIKDSRVWNSITRADLGHCCLLLCEAAAAGVDLPRGVNVRDGPKDGPLHPGFIPVKAEAGKAEGKVEQQPGSAPKAVETPAAATPAPAAGAGGSPSATP